MFEKNNNNIMILKLAGDFKSFSLFQDFVFFFGGSVWYVECYFPNQRLNHAPALEAQSSPLDHQGNLQDFSLTNAPPFFFPKWPTILC